MGKTLRVGDVDDAVSGLTAVRTVLNSQLEDVERLIVSFNEKHAQRDEELTLEECESMRSGVLSALASVQEILSWIRELAETDPEGNLLVCVQALPRISIPRRS
jgi:hypothetical protein